MPKKSKVEAVTLKEKMEELSERYGKELFINLSAAQNEVWKDVKDFEGIYKVSNRGNLKSVDRIKNGRFYTGKSIKLMKDRYGYLKAVLYDGKRIKHTTIHRLVAGAFIKNPYTFPQVNHKDRNKLNNEYWNLSWCTGLMNMHHAERMGLREKAYRIGERSNLSKLTESQVIKLKEELITAKKSALELAKEYNVCDGTIYNIKNGTSWGHLTI